ncbi:HAD family hydrolase [Paenibacillus sp. HN-1]|uniref:HAD family hydrolase n=1 Tax=Paenibacillus TaxID=44249 RepID=UPI001CA800A8|nr:MULTISPECIES: HAD family hydrolase [Paenibacillus]MBY9081411.1 HAD family hydrolase [Paenibacillus sp. CGMCC 1.18879]MBY9084931.1 HAD family hydrolase [Paenibacillus sinensis]
MIDAFIFDMDGVILDSEPLHFEVDLAVLQFLGVASEQDYLERFVGMTNPEMWSIIKVEHGLAQTVEEVIDYQSTRKLELLRDTPMEPIDGIPGLLAYLRSRSIPIGLASSSPRSFIEGVLAKFGWEDVFQCIISGEEVPAGKPAPDIYLETASKLGVSPSSCWVLEDSRNGVTAAKAAGMRCIGFLNPNSGNQDLSRADAVIHSIQEIYTVLPEGGRELEV